MGLEFWLGLCLGQYVRTTSAPDALLSRCSIFHGGDAMNVEPYKAKSIRLVNPSIRKTRVDPDLKGLFLQVPGTGTGYGHGRGQ